MQAVASQLRNDPSTLALLRERNPALAEALLSGNMTRFGSELGKIRLGRLHSSCCVVKKQLVFVLWGKSICV